MNEFNAEKLSKDLCVTPQFILDYAPTVTGVWLWEIGKVITFDNLKRDSVYYGRNPQQFAYTPLSDPLRSPISYKALSYGESF